MGIFDKAKNSLSSRFGDETVRKGQFSVPVEDDEDYDPNNLSSYHEEEVPHGESTSQDADGLAAFRSSSPGENQSVEEVLESMNINKTFVVPEEVLFVDEELASVSFSVQAPKGYDMGEVDFFVQRTQKSVAKYVDLLRQRNKDVMKLGAQIVSLVSKNNDLKFNNEFANGINIMSSSGDEEELAVQVQELTLKNRQLQEALDAQDGGLYPAPEDSEDNLRLRDELSIVTREKNALEQRLDDLTSQLIYLEEELDITIFKEDGALNDNPLHTNNDGGFDTSAAPAGRAEEDLYASETDAQIGVDGVFANQAAVHGHRTQEPSLLDDEDEVSLDFEEDFSLDLDEPATPLSNNLSYNESNDNLETTARLNSYVPEETHLDDSLDSGFSFEPGSEGSSSSATNYATEDSLIQPDEGYFDENNNWIVDGEIRGFTDDEGYFREGYFDDNDEWVETAVYEPEDEDTSYEESALSSSTISYDDTPLDDSPLGDFDSFEEEGFTLDDFSEEEHIPSGPALSYDQGFEDSAFAEDPYEGLEDFIKSSGQDPR